MNPLRQVFTPRTQFVIPQKVQWFPGHMRKGIRDIGKTLKHTDLILEVHDARIPFSGRNLNLISRISSIKPVILLLNKCDLIDSSYYSQIEKQLLKNMEKHNVNVKNILFFNSIKNNAKEGGYDQKFLGSILKSIEKNSNADSNRGLFMNDNHLNLLVMGIPNVGKSTVINRLRNVYFQKAGKPASVGPTAGVTRTLMERIKICESPRKIYLFDTPGILEPSFHRLETEQDKEALMRCALCANLSDNVVTFELISDYLLYWLNKNNDLTYVDYLGLPAPTNDIIEALTYGAIHFKKLDEKKCFETGEKKIVPKLNLVAEQFVRHFRKGGFGQILLDRDGFDFE